MNMGFTARCGKCGVCRGACNAPKLQNLPDAKKTAPDWDGFFA